VVSGDNWSYKSCRAPVKSSPPTNQHPVPFTDRMPFLSPNQQCQSTEGKTTVLNGSIKSHTGEDMGQFSAGPVNKAVTSASVARVWRYKNLIIIITSVTNSLTKVREG